MYLFAGVNFLFMFSLTLYLVIVINLDPRLVIIKIYVNDQLLRPLEAAVVLLAE